MLHITEDCTGMRTNMTIKDGMGGSVRSKADTVKQYKKSEKKWKKNLKALNKKNNILYSLAKKSGLRREIKISRGSSKNHLRRVYNLVSILPVMIQNQILDCQRWHLRHLLVACYK